MITYTAQLSRECSVCFAFLFVRTILAPRSIRKSVFLPLPEVVPNIRGPVLRRIALLLFHTTLLFKAIFTLAPEINIKV